MHQLVAFSHNCNRAREEEPGEKGAAAEGPSHQHRSQAITVMAQNLLITHILHSTRANNGRACKKVQRGVGTGIGSI